MLAETSREKATFDFARSIVTRLREAGFEAYFAGGCVRDRLMGLVPQDYDVATSAEPPAVQEVFGRRRTMAVGAAFGVIMVKGSPEVGAVEVATFRRDLEYRDGRHPEGVVFSSAEEDAQRRDFTINGLFYDPLENRVIDFVGGREDIRRGVIRAIGDPRARFGEDKLRLLRAVRFAARFAFSLDEATRQAIAEMAPEIAAVSAERIAGEMERMLVDPGRRRAMELLRETGLAAVLLPELSGDDPQDRWAENLAVLERLEAPSLPLALAALLAGWVTPAGARGICSRWRLSQANTRRVAWLLANRGLLPQAQSLPWSRLQSVVVDDRFEDLYVWEKVRARVRGEPHEAWSEPIRRRLAQPRERLDPPPLITGNDLIASGFCAGPRFALVLKRIREAQLDGSVATKAEALTLARRLFDGEE